MSDVSAAAEGSSLLSTIAPGSPTPFSFRSSSVMLFSRKAMSGIPQKSEILACSNTRLASWSAASPVMSSQQTLHHQGTRQWYEKHREGLGKRSPRQRRATTHRMFAFLSAQGVLTQTRTLCVGSGAPELGHGASLERLAQLGDALSGVGALARAVEAAEFVAFQAARGGVRWV